MRVRVRGKLWRLLFERLPKSADYFGVCDAPNVHNKAIRVDRRLSGEKRLEVVLHELLHAGHWDMSEEAVEEFARDAARILTRLGYHNGDHE